MKGAIKMEIRSVLSADFCICISVLVMCTFRSETIFGNSRPFKKMKNVFYFTIKALLVIQIFKFFPLIFGHVGKRLEQKNKVNFKIYDVKISQGVKTIKPLILVS